MVISRIVMDGRKISYTARRGEENELDYSRSNYRSRNVIRFFSPMHVVYGNKLAHTITLGFVLQTSQDGLLL